MTEKAHTPLQHFLDALPDATLEINHAGWITNANIQTEKMFGYVRSELIGKAVEMLIPERLHDVHMRHRSGYTANPQARPMGAQLDLLGRRKDGTEFPVQINLSPFHTDHHFAILCSIRDNSEQKRAYRLLEEYAREVEDLYNNAPCGYHSIDSDGVFVRLNDTELKWLGYAREEMIGKMKPTDMMTPASAQAFNENFSRFKEHGSVFELEFEMLRKDGTTFPVHSSATAVRDAAGNFMMSRMTLLNIATRKQAERFLAAQYDINSILASAATLEEAMPKLLCTVCEKTSWDVGEFWLIDQRAHVARCVEFWHVPAIKLHEFQKVARQSRYPMGVGMPGRVWKSGQPAWIVDVLHDDNFPRAPFAAAAGLHSALGYPITLRQEVIGVMGFFSREVRQPNPDQLRMFDALSSQIGQFIERKRAELAVLDIAKGVSATTGEMFFRSLVEHLAKTLEADYAFVGELTGRNLERVRTIAVWAEGKIADNFEYDLMGTPCKNVTTESLCSYASGVQCEFPQDELLRTMQVEGYVGTPLFDAHRRAFGLMVVLYRRPISHPRLVESMLNIFAVRAAAELERRRFEKALRANEEQLRRLATHLQASHEAERTHLAREVHDELGQYLTGLKMDVTFMEDLLKAPNDEANRVALRQKASAMSKLLDTSVQSVRKISTALRPVVLDRLGLLAAIEWQAEEFQERTGIRCECFLTVAEVNLDRDCATAVFRILQEALTNVMRHAFATRVTIAFVRETDHYLFEVKDNGKGVQEDEPHKLDALGILGMQERAQVFGGTVTLIGEPGKGTTVSVTIPFPPSIV